jgi:hypothetical protein
MLCVCEEKVFIQGTELKIKGFPFISQDTDATVCAESSLWMLLRYFSNRYNRYSEIYPFQIGELTRDYSIGRIHPSTGLRVWQMAEALKHVGFSPLIYSRSQYKELFEHYLYTYIESGIPVILCSHNHAVVGFGHQSSYVREKIPQQRTNFSSCFNHAFIINNDNCMPYQLLCETPLETSSALESQLSYKDIESFIVPLAEKIFLPAEAFQTLVTTFLDDPTFGYKKYSPTLTQNERLIFRLFLTSVQSFKKHLKNRGMGSNLVEEAYRNMPLPHFVWICEISTPDLYLQGKILGEIIWDATKNSYESMGCVAVHYPEVLLLDMGSALNKEQKFELFQLNGFTFYEVYRNNLKEVKQ